MASRLAIMVATLWWGMTTGLAFVAVPSLFAQLGNPAVAGPVAAWLFAVVAKLSMGCGVGLTLYLRLFSGLPLDGRVKFAIYFSFLAVLAAVLQDGVVAQQIVTARGSGGSLRLWHGLGTLLVFTQWVGALVVSWVLVSRLCETPARCCRPLFPASCVPPV